MFPRSCAVLATCAVLAGCGASSPGSRPAAPRATSTPADPQPPPRGPLLVKSGATTLRLDNAARRVLDYAGIEVTGIGATTEAGGTLRLPITGGELTTSPLAGRMDYDGGLRVRANGRHVDLTALRFDATTDVITAVVRGRRVPVLRLDVTPRRESPIAGQRIVLGGRAALIGDRIVSWLGRDGDIPVLADGLPLGTVEISAEV